MKNYIIVAVIIILIIVGVVWYQAKNSVAPTVEEVVTTETIPADGEVSIITDEAASSEVTTGVEAEIPAVQ